MAVRGGRRGDNFLAYDESNICDPYTSNASGGYVPSTGRGRRNFSGPTGVMHDKPVREQTKVQLPTGHRAKTHEPRAQPAAVGASEAFFFGDYSTREAPEKSRKVANRFQEHDEFLQDLAAVRQQQKKYASYSKEAEHERLRRQSVMRDELMHDRQLVDEWQKFDPYGKAGAGAPLQRKRHGLVSTDRVVQQQEQAAPASEFHSKFGREPRRPNEHGSYGFAPLITKEHDLLARQPDPYQDALFGREGPGGAPRRSVDGSVVARRDNIMAGRKHFRPAADAAPPPAAAPMTSSYRRSFGNARDFADGNSKTQQSYSRHGRN